MVLLGTIFHIFSHTDVELFVSTPHGMGDSPDFGVGKLAVIQVTLWILPTVVGSSVKVVRSN